MKAIRLSLLIGCLMVVAMGTQAKPEYLDVMTETYKPYAKALSDRACVNCHVSDSDYKRNPYGQQVAQALLNAGTKTLTPEILHSMEALASNPGDISNLEKIKIGLAPGAPRAAGPGDKTGASGGATHAKTTRATEEQKSFLPKNAFHPAIVHFPIALFIAGLLLDLIGFTRNNRTFLLAGWYNLVMAAVSAFGGIATGLLALWGMGLPLKGLIRTHLILAIAATIIMWALVGLRYHRHESMSRPLRLVYILLAVAGLLAISYAGHLGGLFVYGE